MTSTMNLNFSPLDTGNLSADIARQIRTMMATGALNPGNKLPSTRVLAKELKVSRGTVVTALETLVAEGYLESRTGAGTFVAKGCELERVQPAVLPPRKFALKKVKPNVDASFKGRLNFQACRPSLEAFPKMAWRRAAADAASRLPDADYGDPQGEPELRRAIASYLCRARGLDVTADEIIVTNGALHAMHVFANVYLGNSEEVAFEDPGYPLARQTLADTGAKIRAVPVDEHGIIVDQLPNRGHSIRCVYVTPSHQFPTGVRLSLQRRHQLIQWAKKNDAVVIEDDYDGEFRYDVAPLPPMASMINDGSILYCGTFSKTLFPSLRLGFAAGSKTLISAMAQYRATTDYQTNSLTQRTLSNFIQGGEFEKHIYRMRRRYAAKRKALCIALSDSRLPGALTGTESGLNAMFRLDVPLSAAAIARKALDYDVWVPPVSRYALADSVEDTGLVLGYASLSDTDLKEGVEKIAQAIRVLES